MTNNQNPFQRRRESQIIEEISGAGLRENKKIDKEIEKKIEKKEEDTLQAVKEEKKKGEKIDEKREEDDGGLGFLKNVMEKPKKEESKGKNLYLSMDNIKAIERLSKKAGKSHSQFTDDLLTEVFKMME